VDTLKSLAVVTLLGAVLYGVYVVASKPDKPLSPELEAAARNADAPPQVDEGRSTLSPPTILGASDRTSSDTASNSTQPQERESAYQPRRSTNPDDTASPRETIPDLDVRGAGFSRTADIERDAASSVLPAVSPDSASPSSASRDAEIEAAKQRMHVYAFHQTWKTAQDQVADGRYREALLALTAFYNDPVIPNEQREELLGWLDALAAKVVYSSEHLMAPAYVASRNETLYTISEKYHVPYLLLKNINGVRDPELILTGTKLKVVPGPFRAEVDLARSEITVFVQNLYAGRFPFSLGNEPARPGEYTVRSKDPAKSYPSPQGMLAPKDPRNPYGGLVIILDNEVCIHGSPSDAYANQRAGCIGLAQRDAEDLFAILSEKESKVVIKK